jgi:hypothetical protein
MYILIFEDDLSATIRSNDIPAGAFEAVEKGLATLLDTTRHPTEVLQWLDGFWFPVEDFEYAAY